MKKNLFIATVAISFFQSILGSQASTFSTISLKNFQLVELADYSATNNNFYSSATSISTKSGPALPSSDYSPYSALDEKSFTPLQQNAAASNYDRLASENMCSPSKALHNQSHSPYAFMDKGVFNTPKQKKSSPHSTVNEKSFNAIPKLNTQTTTASNYDCLASESMHSPSKTLRNPSRSPYAFMDKEVFNTQTQQIPSAYSAMDEKSFNASQTDHSSSAISVSQISVNCISQDLNNNIEDDNVTTPIDDDPEDLPINISQHVTTHNSHPLSTETPAINTPAHSSSMCPSYACVTTTQKNATTHSNSTDKTKALTTTISIADTLSTDGIRMEDPWGIYYIKNVSSEKQTTQASDSDKNKEVKANEESLQTLNSYSTQASALLSSDKIWQAFSDEKAWQSASGLNAKGRKHLVRDILRFDVHIPNTAFYMTKHALERMIERKILLEEISDTLISGKGPVRLPHGVSRWIKNFLVVIADKYYVVTAYRKKKRNTQDPRNTSVASSKELLLQSSTDLKLNLR